MTRKDYELISKVLRNSDEMLDEIQLEALAENFAEALAKENPRFDRARFLVAAGVIDRCEVRLCDNPSHRIA